MRSWRKAILAALFTLVLLASGCASPATDTPGSSTPTTKPPPTSTPRPTEQPTPTESLDSALVVRIVDGDTIEIEGGQIVRYIGIDTPEDTSEVQCFGGEATRRNSELVLGKRVELERDVSETDRFGRLLRYVWVDGRMVNEVLVAEGYATASTYPPDVKHQARFTQAQRLARDAGLGLWTECVASNGSCHPSYPGICVPPPPPDLDCGDIEARSFQVVGDDPHNFDGNRDGVGCEP